MVLSGCGSTPRGRSSTWLLVDRRGHQLLADAVRPGGGLAGCRVRGGIPRADTNTGPAARPGCLWSAFPWTLAAAIWTADGRSRRVPLGVGGLEAIWFWFRDHWGVVWALRVQERFNRSAESLALADPARLVRRRPGAGLRGRVEARDPRRRRGDLRGPPAPVRRARADRREVAVSAGPCQASGRRRG